MLEILPMFEQQDLPRNGFNVDTHRPATMQKQSNTSLIHLHMRSNIADPWCS